MARMGLTITLVAVLGLAIIASAVEPPRELIGAWRTWSIFVADSESAFGCQAYPPPSIADAHGSPVAGFWTIHRNGNVTHVYRAPALGGSEADGEAGHWDTHAYDLLDWERLFPTAASGGSTDTPMMMRFDRPTVFRLWLGEHTYVVRDAERVCMLASLAGTPAAGYTLSVFRQAVLGTESPFPGVPVRLPSLAPSRYCPALERWEQFPQPGFTRLRAGQPGCGFLAPAVRGDPPAQQLARVLEVATVGHTLGSAASAAVATIPTHLRGTWVRQRRLLTDHQGGCALAGVWGRLTINASHVVFEDEGQPTEIWEAAGLQVDQPLVPAGVHPDDLSDDRAARRFSPNSDTWDIRRRVPDSAQDHLALRLFYRILDRFPRFPGDRPRFRADCLSLVDTGVVRNPWLPADPSAPPSSAASISPAQASSLVLLELPGRCEGFRTTDLSVIDETRMFCGLQARYGGLAVSQFVQTEAAAGGSGGSGGGGSGGGSGVT